MSNNTIGMLSKGGVSVLGGLVGYLWGEWTPLLSVLTALIILDYFGGVLAGFVEAKLSSSIGFKGIAKKLGIFLFVAVAHLVDKVLGDGSITQDAVIFFYIGNELLSLVENGGRIGLPIPTVLTNAVTILKSKSDKMNKGE